MSRSNPLAEYNKKRDFKETPEPEGKRASSKGEVKNLTTAAHLWLTTVISIACGAGQWPLVVICTLISLLMLTVVGVVERLVFPAKDDPE